MIADRLTIADAARRIAARDLSPVELTESCLERIARLDPQLNAFLEVTAERAVAGARAAESRMLAGTLKGPLDGIPIAHKDNYDTAGIPTTAHSRLLRTNVPCADAHVVSRLADAGTVLLGKLSMHEFAMGGPSYDLRLPPTRNPWDPERTTAGSSAGTAAAVAAGLVLGGTGSDTGGSIRSPAALCGVAGLKPTYGLCSRAGTVPLAFTLDHTGPIAWTSEDCALLLQAMAGHDPRDPASARRPVPDFTAELGTGLRGLRIGVVRHWFEEDHRASDATIAAIDGALDVLRAAGATVHGARLSPLEEYHAVGYVLLLTEAFAVHAPCLRERYAEYSKKFRTRVALAALASGGDLVQAARRRRVLCDEMKTAMERVDVLVSACQFGEARRIVDAADAPSIPAKPSFTMPLSVTGHPAISVRTGFGADGLPLAMQLVGRPFAESTLFRVANAYETATAWRDRRPALLATVAD